MKQKSRIEKVGAALRRQRSGGRVLMRFEEGDTFHDGVKVDPATITDADTLIVITHEAKPGTVNLKRLTWNDNPMHGAGDE